MRQNSLMTFISTSSIGQAPTSLVSGSAHVSIFGPHTMQPSINSVIWPPRVIRSAQFRGCNTGRHWQSVRFQDACTSTTLLHLAFSERTKMHTASG